MPTVLPTRTNAKMNPQLKLDSQATDVHSPHAPTQTQAPQCEDDQIEASHGET